jgi:pyruvate,orthophosphate dikinase
MTKWIYFFDDATNPKLFNNELFGGKGKALTEMASLALPVPAGFVITTELCKYYYQNNKTLPKDFNDDLQEAIKTLEQKTGKQFGGKENPLLVSVRSGAPISMPGMMDTILNLGLNEQSVEALSQKTKNPKFALDSFRRLIQMYSSVVLDVSHHNFETILTKHQEKYKLNSDSEFNAEQLKEVIEDYLNLVEKETKAKFPAQPGEQLTSAIKAVLDSWMNPRAITYRKINKITEDSGTAVTIQSMVFGNMGETSATGVAFTRNPSNGEKYLYGEFLINAQGEDVVAGIRTPFPINAFENQESSMETMLPQPYKELKSIANLLETHFKDMQDIEFTIEQGKFYILQTRSGKRSALAAIKIAVDMVSEKLITKEEAICRVEPESLNQLLHARIDYSAPHTILTQGLPASPGAAYGAVVFSAKEAEELAGLGKVILIRHDTCPEDIKGMHVAEGILTARGGMTSHAAVVARGMGKPCVCGASNIFIDQQARILKIGEHEIRAGEFITIDGSNGKVILGEAHVIPQEFPKEFITIMQWADSLRRLDVRTNAETYMDTEAALKFGAQGIGLCRTEHMFFDPQKISLVRRMIAATTKEQRQQAIDEIFPLHKEDFKQIFALIKNLPVTIRLLDPPLHEFLPHYDPEIELLANELNLPMNIVKHRIDALKESNPMLGHRGCRLAITYPEIYEMQLKAIFHAALEVREEYGINPKLEIMIPLISNIKELELLSRQVSDTAKSIFQNSGKLINYSIGTMIELPRAALLSDQIAEYVEFFSFGTNDLTQTTYGLSRDDTGSFSKDYMDKGIFKDDPFVRIDEEGVGELIKISINKARETRGDIKFGVCGEHGGNPESIYFFETIGLDYVSCSPYRVPIARLAAAQAAVKNELK